MRRPRTTIWRWTVAVAVLGLMIGGRVRLKQRRDYFLLLAQSHQMEVASSRARGEALKSRLGSTSRTSNEEIMRLHRDYDRMRDRADHHAALAHKYEQAAGHPWLHIEPDPPEPD
jgi:hypothetical protein